MPRLLLCPCRICTKSKNPLAGWRVGQELKIAGYYAAGSPECRTHVLVPVLVHMAMIIIARFWLPFIRQHYIHVRNSCQGQNFESAKAKKTSNTEGKRQRRKQISLV